MATGNDNEGKSLFEGIIPDMEMARALGLNAMMILALPGEVLLRHQFGERYFRGYKVFFAFLVLVLLNATGSYLAFLPRNLGRGIGADAASPSPGSAPLMGYFIALFLLLCMAHRLDSFRRRFQNIRLHSFSSGRSWFEILPLSERAVQLWIEPVVLISLGLISRALDPILGWVFFAAAVTLFAKEIWMANVMRNRFLDLMDSQIEAENMIPAAVDQKPSRETEGFKVAGALPFRSREQRERLVASLAATKTERLAPPASFALPATPILPSPDLRPASLDQTIRQL